MRADLGALTAPDARTLIDAGLACGVLLHLARTAAGSHADVLDGAAKAGLLMALEVRHRDEDVGVHDGTADLGLLDELAAHDRYLDVVRALETVGDDDVAAGAERVEAVGVRGVEVVEGILAAAHVEGVAVGEEGLAAELADEVDDDLDVIGAQVGRATRLAEVQLDRHELVVEVDGLDAGLAAEAIELDEGALPSVGAEVGEVDLCGRLLGHGDSLLVGTDDRARREAWACVLLVCAIAREAFWLTARNDLGGSRPAVGGAPSFSPAKGANALWQPKDHLTTAFGGTGRLLAKIHPESPTERAGRTSRGAVRATEKRDV